LILLFVIFLLPNGANVLVQTFGFDTNLSSHILK